MAYREITTDGKGNIIEDKVLCTLEEYKNQLLTELKERHRMNFPSLEKQINMVLGFVSGIEHIELREQMRALLEEYESMKVSIKDAKTHEEAHKIVYTRGTI